MRLLFVLGAAAVGWVSVTSFPQGKIYRREDRGSPLLALRAEGRIAAPAWAVRKVVLHPSSYPGLTPYLVDEKVLAVDGCEPGATALPGCKQLWVYNKYDPPVIDPRDYTLHVTIERDALPERFLLDWELAPERGPGPVRGVVRMNANRGQWDLAVDGEETRYAYELAIDPGGAIPAWIVNNANASDIPRMLGAVEKAARRLAEEHADAEEKAHAEEKPSADVQADGGASPATTDGREPGLPQPSP